MNSLHRTRLPDWIGPEPTWMPAPKFHPVLRAAIYFLGCTLCWLAIAFFAFSLAAVIHNAG